MPPRAPQAHHRNRAHRRAPADRPDEAGRGRRSRPRRLLVPPRPDRSRNLALDEPMNGLDPQGMEWMRAFLRDAAASGHAVLVSSHLLGEMETLADRLVVIDNGRLLGQWDVADLLHARSRQALLRTDDDERVEQALRGLRVPVTALPEGLCVTFDETVPEIGRASCRGRVDGQAEERAEQKT